MRYWNGAVELSVQEMVPANGGLFGYSRTYNNQTQSDYDGPNGWNWFLPQLPYLSASGSSRIVVFDPNNPIWFDWNGSAYVPRFGQLGVQLVPGLIANQLVFIQNTLIGTVRTYFNDGGASSNPWQMASRTEANSVVLNATYSGSNLQELQRSYSSGMTTTYESMYYEYYTSGDNVGKLQYITYRRGSSPSGPWTNILRVAFTYYGLSESNGSLNDLKQSTQQLYNGTSWDDVAIRYYRYYKSGDTNGFAHALKIELGPEGYRRAFNDGVNFTSASDATLKDYADHYFEYDSTSRAVTLEIAAVCQSCPGGGTTSDSFAITARSPVPADDYNTWKTKNVQTLPNSATITVYSSYAGLPILHVYTDGSDQWCQFWRYNANGQVIVRAESSAISGYSESYDDLVNYNGGGSCLLYPSDGLLRVFDYYSTTDLPNGKVANYTWKERLWQGRNAVSDVLLRSHTYLSHSDSDGNTIYLPATDVDYPDASNTSITITTSYAYTFSGTNQMTRRTITRPIVVSGQNGSGNTVTFIEDYDSFGNLIQTTDERGIVNQYVYDVVKGVIIQQTLNYQASGSGPGVNVVSDFTYDDFGRLVQVLGPSHTVVLSGTATTVRTATWTVYTSSVKPGSAPWDLDQIWVGQGYATGSSPSYTYSLINPVNITRMGKDGKVIDQITSKRSSGSGKLSPTDTFNQTDWQSWTSTQYDDQGRTTSKRVYHLIPSSGTGSAGTNYGETDYGYDSLERLNRVQSHGGTITKTVWTAPQRVQEIWVGTDDSGTGSDNMVKVTEYEYDGGSAGGDGNVTQVTQYADATGSGTSDSRVTTYTYDFRNRRITMDGEVDVYEEYTYDNLDRLTQTDRKDTSSGGHLIGRSQTAFDDRGRVYQQIVYAVDPSTGTVGNALTTNNWYDESGNLIKQITGGSGLVFSKTDYNGVNWPTATYSGYCTTNSYTTATTLANDTITEQTENTFDEAGNVVSQAMYQRLNDTTGTGALTAGSAPIGRVSYTASWFDGINRSIAMANYGASSFSRPSTPPASSSTVLVTSTTYDDAGRVYQITDPLGLVSQSTYDNAGRTTQTIAAVSGSSADDLNQTTNYTYTLDNLIATLTAVNSRTGDQTTTYTYGTTTTESGVASNLLLRYTDYPDSVSGSDRVAMTYNRLGQVTTRTDQRGTVRTFNYDKLGRVTDDRVTTNGTGTDVAVKRISSTYEVRGMITTITSYDNPTPGSGSVLNQIKFTYNTFSQLVTEAQDHATTVSGSTPTVQYAFATGASSSNQIRPTTLTYPSSRAITYDYGTAGGINDRLNRLNAIKDGSTSLAAYTYLGASLVIRIDYSEPSVRLDLWGGTSGTFNGIDRFNRIIDQRWVTFGGTDKDRYKYGYDQDSNRFYRQNTVGSALDEFYTYDHLNRLDLMQRGTLTGGPPFTGISGTPVRELDYTLDPTGNWKNYLTKTSGTTDLNQNRTSNSVNQITTISASTGTTWATPAYDAAGNMTTMPQPASLASSYTGVYDAWNRLVKISSGGTTVAEYQYDGRGRRILKKTYTGGSLTETRHFYWSSTWQDLEERIGTSTTPAYQQVWGARYIDELVCRDYASGSSSASSGGGPPPPPSRIYVCQDANFNVTALLDASASVLERFRYEPYGTSTVLDSGWSPTSDAYGWAWRHQGLYQDVETALIYNRMRYLHPSLGSFIQQDPLGFTNSIISIQPILNSSKVMPEWQQLALYSDEPDLYQYVRSNPLANSDPTGAITCLKCWSNYNAVRARWMTRWASTLAYRVGKGSIIVIAGVAGTRILIYGAWGAEGGPVGSAVGAGIGGVATISQCVVLGTEISNMNQEERGIAEGLAWCLDHGGPHGTPCT